MNPSETTRRRFRNAQRSLHQSASALLILVVGLLCPVARAFPPAPHHIIYGTVRDQYGTPLMTDQAQVILVTPAGVQLTATVVPGLGFDFNYQLDVPMDAGLTADPYEPNALMAGATFNMYVVMGGTTNFPIEMIAGPSQLGQPSQQNRMDLTLGVDSNGDGIPDAWESAYLGELGSNLGLGSINANSVIGPNGLTVRQEFLVGYYPYDPTDTLKLQLLNVSASSTLLQFIGVTGRYYSLIGSSDLRSWVPLSFRIPTEGGSGPLHTYFFAPEIQTVQVQAIQPGLASPPVLGFGRIGNQVSLSWPTNAPGFRLVSSTSLAAPSWQPVTTTPTVVGGRYVVTSTVVGSRQFYRLSSDPIRFFRLVLQ